MESKVKKVIPDEVIIHKIYFIRDQKIMIDKDLAALYGVGTRDLNKAVSRNLKRFPEDFMFRLTKSETEILMFQIGTSSWGGTRKLPNAFTEQGIAMLSSVLHSDLAIQTNIRIIRIFTKVRKLLETHQEILQRIVILEKNDEDQEKKIILILDYLKSLEQKKQKEQELSSRKIIGYRISEK